MSKVAAAYAALGLAIVFEVVGTMALQASQQWTRPLPTALMAVCYLSAFYFLSVVLRTMPVGLAYAIWSGLGTVLVALLGWVAFRQRLDAPAVLGLALIVSGVLVVNLFSKSVSH